MSDAPATILEFDHATTEPDPGYDAGLFDATFTLTAGALTLIRLEREAVRLPLGDAACGAVELENGAVRFMGDDWRKMSFRQAIHCRGKIGRTFEGHGWVSNLDVDENVMLAQRHHTTRTDTALAEEAAKLARQFGLPGLPRGRPTSTRRHDLQRAALVRAFLGSPDLLILERPEAEIFPQIMPSLINSVRAARHRGAAVLWLTNKTEVWQDRGIRATSRFAVSGSQLLTADDERL